MVIYIMQYHYRNRYLVVIDGDVYVYKNDKYKFDPPFFSFKPKHFSNGKSKDCEMTEFSGAANDDSDFEGNTLLLEVEHNEYVYFSGLEISKTDDKIIDCISLMGNNMVPYAIILGEKYTYFLYNRYKFFENGKIEEGTLLHAINASLDPFDYHHEKCGKDSYKKLKHRLIHTCWPGHGEDGEDADEISDEEDEIEEDENFFHIILMGIMK